MKFTIIFKGSIDNYNVRTNMFSLNYSLNNFSKTCGCNILDDYCDESLECI